MSVWRIEWMLPGILLAVFASIESSQAQDDNGQDDPIPLAVEQDLPLAQFIDFVADELGIRMTFDESALAEANQQSNKVYIRGIDAAEGVTREELLLLLKSSLRAKGLALVDAEFANWKRIVKIEDARPYLPQGRADQFQTGDLITQVFEIKHAPIADARQLITPFLSVGGANNPESIDSKNLLIVTDFVSNMRRIEERLSLIDAPPEQVIRVFRQIEHLQASELKTRLDEVLGIIEGSVDSGDQNAQQPLTTSETSVRVIADDRTNRLLLVGPKASVDDVEMLIEEFDVSLEWETRIYQFNNASAARIDELVRQMIGEQRLQSSYESTIEENSNRLIVRATESVHQQIDTLRQQIDGSPNIDDSPDGQSGNVRYYRPRFVKVRDILDTIRAVERNRLESQQGFGGSRGSTNRGIRTIGDPFENVTPFPSYPPFESSPAVLPNQAIQNGEIGSGDVLALPVDRASQSVIPGEARVTVDENTNTLIVVADPDVQELYREMIEWLDKPRPQVMIEAKVVAVDASDDYTIGIELSGGDRTGGQRLFGFTSHGFSTIDATTGALTLLPGLGFNGALIDPDIADVVIRALTSHDRARVVTAPRILVNDNATGELSSVDEVPFTSINAANTVSTTSFAGFAEAGTTISVTPRISEGDHLSLEFRITVNDFTGAGGAGVPPPRQTNEVVSEITIPDGHTVIVGGLRRKRSSQDIESIPIIERIPILRLLGGRDDTANSEDAIFVFIRPVILRDDQFADLRILSQQERDQAGIPHDLPYSEPIIIR